MAHQAYLRLTGKNQGEIKGSITQKGREDSIGVIAVKHEVTSPRDAATGLSTGKRMHKPYVITKELDKSSPLLYNAMINNELISEFSVQHWTSSPTGAEVQHYTVELNDATISNISSVMLNTRVPELQNRKEYEEVSFTYRKIIWTWVDGGITAEDDWEAPVV